MPLQEVRRVKKNTDHARKIQQPSVTSLVVRFCHFEDKPFEYDDLDALIEYTQERLVTFVIHPNVLNLDCDLTTTEGKSTVKARKEQLIKLWFDGLDEWCRNSVNQHKLLTHASIKIISAEDYRTLPTVVNKWNQFKLRYEEYLSTSISCKKQTTNDDGSIERKKINGINILKNDVLVCLKQGFIRSQAQQQGINIEACLSAEQALLWEENPLKFIELDPNHLYARIATHILTEAYDHAAELEPLGAKNKTLLLMFGKDHLTGTMKHIKSMAKALGYERESLDRANLDIHLVKEVMPMHKQILPSHRFDNRFGINKECDDTAQVVAFLAHECGPVIAGGFFSVYHLFEDCLAGKMSTQEGIEKLRKINQLCQSSRDDQPDREIAKSCSQRFFTERPRTPAVITNNELAFTIQNKR